MVPRAWSGRFARSRRSRPRAPCSAPRSTPAAADSLLTLFGYGIQPEAQGIYQVLRRRRPLPGDTSGVLLSEPAARLLGAGPGDTVTLAGRLDPQIALGAVGRRLVARGMVRWLYDYRGQPSVGTVLPGDAAARPATRRRSSLAAPGEGSSDAAVEPLAWRLRERHSGPRGEQRRRSGGPGQAPAGLLHPALLRARRDEPDRRGAPGRHPADHHRERAPRRDRHAARHRREPRRPSFARCWPRASR